MINRNHNVYTLSLNETYQIGYNARKMVEERERINK